MREPQVVPSKALTRTILAIAVGIASSAPSSPSPAFAAPVPDAPTPNASAWILVDTSDGAVLAAEDPREELAIASATKLMTTYLLLSELDPGDPVVGVPYEAGPLESLLGLEAGEVISARDLAYGLILASANDGAVAAANAIDGSVEAFVEHMNETARTLGLTETSFANPIGFDDPANYSSASDLATLTARLFDDELFRRIADTEDYVVETDRRELPISSRNSLLGRAPWIDGVKTGFTAEAGNVLVASGTRAGTTLVSVVLGAPDELSRDQGSLELLRHGFSLLEREEEADEDEGRGSVDVEGEDAVEGVAAAPPGESDSPLLPIALGVASVILIAVLARRRQDADR